MPVYTCTLTQDTLTATSKATLAAEITRIHSAINHVPSTYVNVVFHELPPDNVYTDSVRARPLLINGWARSGHPQKSITELALEIATAASRITGIDKNKVLVVIQDSPASSAVEGGRVLPEPGREQAWINQE